MNVLQNTLKLKFLETINNIKMTKNKLKLTLKTVALLTITTLTINTASAQLHVTKPDGNVGIGIETPIKKLHVKGMARITPEFNKAAVIQLGGGRAKNGLAYIDTYPIAGGSWVGRLLSNADGVTTFSHKGESHFQLRTYGKNSHMRFIVFGTEALTVAPNGNVGIGTTDPGPNPFKFQVTGAVAKRGNADDTWTILSDKRTKKNINSFKLGLNEVLKLNPVTFNYNGKAGVENTDKEYVGLVAQEFAKIMPSAVSKYVHNDTISNKTEDYLSMNASSVKYMLVNAIKEQQSLIETQKAELETLKATVTKLAENSSPVSTPGATEISVLLEGTGTENALLAQNTPNPFTTKTRIEYFIPTNSRNARMSFRDMTGKEIKRVELTNDGIGAIELSAKDLAVGIYSYVLYVNGSIVASKKMVLKQ